MKYRIEFTPSAARDIKKITGVVLKRIDTCLMALADNPFPSTVKRLTGEVNFYRVRVGDYRIIYSVENDVFIVLVIKIGHRREIYR